MNLLRLYVILLFAAFVVPNQSSASHITGGGFSYKYLGDSTIGGTNVRNYEVTLTIYEDCINGQPEAITQDNPAFFSAFLNNSSYTRVGVDTAVYFASSKPVPVNVSNNCNVNSVSFPLCLIKKTFTKRYSLPVTSFGYSITYQRCCRNASIMNIKTPGDIGLTFYCTIPGNLPNNGAVFKNEPQQVFCLQQMVNFDHSATDADGDSLSYEFSPAIEGASDVDIKPIPGPPPFDSVKYSAPYTSQQPISSDIPFSINPVSGKISGIPNRTGKYVVSVCCKEWRNRQLINITYREFCVVVGQCTTINSSFTPDVSNDTVLFAGQRIRLNGGSGIFHHWSPGILVSDSTTPNPIAYFPNPGIYKLRVSVINDSGCNGTGTITIDVIEHSEFAVPNAFSPNGDNVNDVLRPIPVKGSTLISFKVFDRWGKMVYNGGPADPGWNGTYKGTMQDMAVFFWTLEYEDTQGERHTMSGNVTLVR